MVVTGVRLVVTHHLCTLDLHTSLHACHASIKIDCNVIKVHDVPLNGLTNAFSEYPAGRHFPLWLSDMTPK